MAQEHTGSLHSAPPPYHPLERVRMAIIGAGTWGRNHARIYQAHPYAEVVAIADRDGERALAAVEALGQGQAFDDVEAMLSAVDCDAVAVVTPDFAHREGVELAAKHGKHILVEKPLATSQADLEAMLKAIHQARAGAGIRVMVDLHNRWNPPFHEAWRSVREGRIGELRSAYIRLNDIQWVATDLLPWAAQSSILWFLGSHSLDTLRWIADSEVRRVYSVKREGVLKARGIDVVDQYLTTLEFDNGVVAQMENGWITADNNTNVNDFRCTLLGSEGQIEINASGHDLIRTLTPEGLRVPDVLVQHQVYGRPVGFAYESIRAFVGCLLTGEDFPISLEDATRGVEVILAIMDSAERGEPVEVNYRRYGEDN